MNGWSVFCHAVGRTSVAHVMGGSTWLFPLVETIHLSAMVLLVGSITVFDLRLLGISLRGESVSALAERLLPFTWTAFAIMAVTGSLLFTSDAVIKYCPNPAFHIKLVLILFAGLNMSVFHFTVYRNVSKWDHSPTPPLWAKLVGTFSVVLWAGVVVAGRWIGFA
jgi:uncharacterized membrane protein